jgi:hypothetical protein
MKLLFYKIMCWLRNKHTFLYGWENQHSFGQNCQCGNYKTFIHKKQVEWIKKGKNEFTITFKRNQIHPLGVK